MEKNKSLRHGVSLKSFNTFGIDVKAEVFAGFESEDELVYLLDSNQGELPVLILGGGSNVLFTKDYNGLVLKNNIPGVRLIDEDDDHFIVEAGSGVVWHDFVLWCISNGYQGVENLSLIPGCVGAAPIQNIGAYGVELKNTFKSLRAVDKATGNVVSFNRDACNFGYRDSIFKRSMKNKLVITSVQFSLNKKYDLNLSYGAIEQELKNMGVGVPGIRDVSEAVCNIRRSKLPDPRQIGNAGSFFKNPEVESVRFESIKNDFPGIVAYPTHTGSYKLAAGWLIEQCGWKGKRVGNTGSHKDQALVLVNYGNATGNEILDLAMNIQSSVKEKFGIIIEPEVNII